MAIVVRLLWVPLIHAAVLQWCSATLPEFSWDTVPVFFHSSNTSGPYSLEALRVIAKYPMVTIEKWQGFDIKGMDDEDDMVLTMRAVKNINPKVATYFYMNSWKDRPEMTRMNREFMEHPDWALRDVEGNKVKNQQGFYIFDQSNEEVQKWWLNICLNATKAADGDGCFCDSSQHTDMTNESFAKNVSPEKKRLWDEGLLNLTRDVQAALGDDKLLIGKVPDQPYVKSVQIEMFHANNASINNLMLGVEMGKVIQAHVALTDLKHIGGCAGNIADHLAAFLIAAGKYSYYGCGEWNTTGNSTEAFAWRPEYDKPLGAPLGPAGYKSGVWKREFAKGTQVTFDTATNKGTIQWGT